MSFLQSLWLNNKERIIKRLKSLAWKTGVFFVIGLVGFITGFIKEINAPEIVVIIVSLVGAEITKWLNNNVGLFGAKLKK